MSESAPALLIKSDFFDTTLRMVSGSVDTPIYSNLVEAIADKIKEKIKGDGQFMLVIRGGCGSGKSNLALQIIRTINPAFTFEDTYIYSPVDFAKKLKRGSTEPINWFDEAIIMFSSLNIMSAGGRMMGTYFDTMRLDHGINILCLPNDEEIDGRVKKHMDMLIECPDKAPLPKWAGFSARGFFEVIHRINYRSGNHYDKTVGFGYCRPVPKKLYAEYVKIKKQHADEYKKTFIERLLK